MGRRRGPGVRDRAVRRRGGATRGPDRARARDPQPRRPRLRPRAARTRARSLGIHPPRRRAAVRLRADRGRGRGRGRRGRAARAAHAGAPARALRLRGGRPLALRGALARPHRRLALRRRRREARPRRGRAGGRTGPLPQPAQALRAPGRRRSLPGTRLRIALRRGDELQGVLDDRLRAALQPGTLAIERGGVRRRPDRRPGTAAPEPRPDRRPEPRPVPRAPTGTAIATGSRERDRPRRARRGRLRGRPRQQGAEHPGVGDELRDTSRISARARRAGGDPRRLVRGEGNGRDAATIGRAARAPRLPRGPARDRAARVRRPGRARGAARRGRRRPRRRPRGGRARRGLHPGQSAHPVPAATFVRGLIGEWTASGDDLRKRRARRRRRERPCGRGHRRTPSAAGGHPGMGGARERDRGVPALRRLILAIAALCAVATWAAGPAEAAKLGLAEVRGADGQLLARADTGSFVDRSDAGWTLRIGSASVRPGAVELRDVTMLGGRVWAARVVVPAHGLTGARVEHLVVDGKSRSAKPNTLIPLGRGSYVVVLQEAVIPGLGTGASGVVGLRVAVGDGRQVLFEPGPRGPGHVGMYVGGGEFVQAPHSGDFVRISSLREAAYALTYVGAVRPY